MNETDLMQSQKVKPPKTYSEQVSIIKSKGFHIDDPDACMAFLHRANYYRLSAYFLPFRKNNSSVASCVKFSRIQRIYEFDSKLRGILFQCIEAIEFYVRTQLAYFSAHHHGPLGYLNPATFNPNKHHSDRFLRSIERCILENKNTLVVRHHIEKYDRSFPIWVIIEFFSMGMLSYFYADLKGSEQKLLAKEMYGTSPVYLRSWLHCITNLRNRCAHYARLYYWLFPVLPKLPKATAVQSALDDHKLFKQIIAAKCLYPEHERWNMDCAGKIAALVKEYAQDIALRDIGFPESWHKLIYY